MKKGNLEFFAKELEKAPLLVEVGEERVWDPTKGCWVSVPLYQAFLVSGYPSGDGSQVTLGSKEG